MKTNSIALLFTFTLVSTVAYAEDNYNGSMLIEELEQEIRGYELGFANGYVYGIYVALPRLCKPDGVNVGQTRQIVYNYMKKHTELWHKSAATSIHSAFTEVWSCKKK